MVLEICRRIVPEKIKITIYSQSSNCEKHLGEELVVLLHCKPPTKRLTNFLIIFKKLLWLPLFLGAMGRIPRAKQVS